MGSHHGGACARKEPRVDMRQGQVLFWAAGFTSDRGIEQARGGACARKEPRVEMRQGQVLFWAAGFTSDRGIAQAHGGACARKEPRVEMRQGQVPLGSWVHVGVGHSASAWRCLCAQRAKGGDAPGPSSIGQLGSRRGGA